MPRSIVGGMEATGHIPAPPPVVVLGVGESGSRRHRRETDGRMEGTIIGAARQTHAAALVHFGSRVDLWQGLAPNGQLLPRSVYFILVYMVAVFSSMNLCISRRLDSAVRYFVRSFIWLLQYDRLMHDASGNMDFTYSSLIW